ncbi:MAG: DMT family transporter, partial [Rickettsiales bacterium]
MSPKYVFYALIVVFCWAANFTAVKIGLQHFPPFLLLVLRFALVAALLLPFYWRRTLSVKFLLAMASVTGTAHFALVFGGLAYGIDIATGILTVQLGVPFSCVLSAVFFKDKLGAWRSFGMVVSFMGVIMIAGTPNVADHFGPFLMTMAGAFCWAAGNVIMKREGEVPVMELLAWMSLFAVPQLLALSLLVERDHWELIQTITPSAAYSIGFSAVFSTLVAYGLWYYLLKRCEVSRVAPFNLLIPFV